VLLEREAGCSVYNLGISGGTPRQYLGNFLSSGVQLEPRLAIVLVYEGNDFKRHRAEQPRSHSPASASSCSRIRRCARG
jgi:hypothetical protein